MPGKRDFHERAIERVYKLLDEPIPWDPVPWWVKIDIDRVEEFNSIQAKLNNKIAEIRAEKIERLAEILEIPFNK